MPFAFILHLLPTLPASRPGGQLRRALGYEFRCHRSLQLLASDPGDLFNLGQAGFSRRFARRQQLVQRGFGFRYQAGFQFSIFGGHGGLQWVSCPAVYRRPAKKEKCTLSGQLNSTSARDKSRWPAYPAYKPSGLPWLGDIPAHWQTRRMKFVAPVSTIKLAEKPADVTYIGLEHIESGTGRLLLDAPVEQVDSAVGVFRKSDVLFGKLRPYLAKVVYADFDGVCTSELLTLQPIPEADGKFLFYLLLSDGFISLVNSMTYGTKMPRASSEQIGNISAPLPPLPEQRAIATFLDRETARLDTLIAKKERLVELLGEKRAALISQAVTRGLDPTTPMKDSGVPWLGQVPKHWEVFPVHARYEVQLGKMLNQDSVKGISPAPYLRNVNIQWDRVDVSDVVEMDFSPAERQKFSLILGDLLVCEGGEVGRTAVWRGEIEGCYFQKAVHRVRPRS